MEAFFTKAGGRAQQKIVFTELYATANINDRMGHRETAGEGRLTELDQAATD